MNPPPDIIDRLEAVLTKQEKLGKVLIASLALIISGALWAARLEWRVADTAAQVVDINTSLKPQVKEHGEKLANIEGRLHGVASQVGKVPSRVAAKLQPEEQQQ